MQKLKQLIIASIVFILQNVDGAQTDSITESQVKNDKLCEDYLLPRSYLCNVTEDQQENFARIFSSLFMRMCDSRLKLCVRIGNYFSGRCRFVTLAMTMQHCFGTYVEMNKFTSSVQLRLFICDVRFIFPNKSEPVVVNF